jgi:hypothetical protein
MVIRTSPSSHAPAPTRARLLALITTAVVLAIASAGAPPAAAEEPSGDADGTAPCRCDDFAAEVASTEALFTGRGEGAAVPTTPAMRARYRNAVNETYRRAACLTQCAAAPDRERNRARVLVAQSAFRSSAAGVPKVVVQERLTAAVAETDRCLVLEGDSAVCHQLHATTRGLLLKDSWNPLNVAAPYAILAEFRAARGDKAPGEDLYDGAATRGETLLLLRAPKFAGGDVDAARRIVEQATHAPRFGCVVSNQVIVAEASARGGDYERAKAELAKAVAAGLPECGEQRYENARTLEDATRCLAKLEANPGVDPGWDDDCS